MTDHTSRCLLITRETDDVDKKLIDDHHFLVKYTFLVADQEETVTTSNEDTVQARKWVQDDEWDQLHHKSKKDKKEEKMIETWSEAKIRKNKGELHP